MATPTPRWLEYQYYKLTTTDKKGRTSVVTTGNSLHKMEQIAGSEAHNNPKQNYEISRVNYERKPMSNTTRVLGETKYIY